MSDVNVLDQALECLNQLKIVYDSLNKIQMKAEPKQIWKMLQQEQWNCGKRFRHCTSSLNLLQGLNNPVEKANNYKAKLVPWTKS
ncbi:CLUMA_CG017903, isoform A [Clunio marinus]|uniref:CLUMA_CG017903, isoform A n=1 Tax=Clunio marinus TaxID=568069 RepID=A0A1J1J1W7_9DIPT|nr:CLUMA_CG017903, isoform A [Clunio marinus]